MRLLFLTQVLDRGDAVLGFLPGWIEGLARRCERVRVVALEVGDATGLPANVDVREVGRKGVVGRYLRYRGFLREALGRDRFDAVLAHMVPRYALVAAGPARRAGARLYLWYTHGAVDERLERAVGLCERVFTATDESLRIATPRKLVTGHGIDLAHFDARGAAPDEPPRLLSVGRLTPSKDPLTILAALKELVGRGRDVHLDLVGGTLAPGDAAYQLKVRERIVALGLVERVVVHGSVPWRDVPTAFRRATAVVNASLTGSLDKVVLEAMAAGRPVLSCNDSFPTLVRELGDDGAALTFPKGDAAALAARVESLLARGPSGRAALGARLAAIVARDHEVDALMGRLVAAMEARA